MAMTADVPKVARVAGLGIVKLAQIPAGRSFRSRSPRSRRIVLDNWDRYHHQSAVQSRRRRGRRRRSTCRADADDATLEAARAGARRRRSTRRPSAPMRSSTARAEAAAWLSGCRSRCAPIAARLRRRRRLRHCCCSVACKRGKEDPSGCRSGAARAIRAPGRPAGLAAWRERRRTHRRHAADRAHPRAQDFDVLVTSGTVTSAALAEQRLPAGVLHQFVPLDAPHFVAPLPRSLAAGSRTVRRIRSVAEPDRRGAERNIPLILVNGRMSERSFTRWRSRRARSPRCSSASICALRNRRRCRSAIASSARRASSRPAISSSTCRRRRPIQRSCAQLQTRSATRPVIAAASTHPGEEAAIDRRAPPAASTRSRAC